MEGVYTDWPFGNHIYACVYSLPVPKSLITQCTWLSYPVVGDVAKLDYAQYTWLGYPVVGDVAKLDMLSAKQKHPGCKKSVGPIRSQVRGDQNVSYQGKLRSQNDIIFSQCIVTNMITYL